MWKLTVGHFSEADKLWQNTSVCWYKNSQFEKIWKKNSPIRTALTTQPHAETKLCQHLQPEICINSNRTRIFFRHTWYLYTCWYIPYYRIKDSWLDYQVPGLMKPKHSAVVVIVVIKILRRHLLLLYYWLLYIYQYTSTLSYSFGVPVLLYSCSTQSSTGGQRDGDMRWRRDGEHFTCLLVVGWQRKNTTIDLIIPVLNKKWLIAAAVHSRYLQTRVWGRNSQARHYVLRHYTGFSIGWGLQGWGYKQRKSSLRPRATYK